MTLAQLEARVKALEEEVCQLRAQVGQPVGAPNGSPPWWVSLAGQFADSPVFDEVVRLGREYRESLRPGRRKKATPKAKKAKGKKTRDARP